MPPVPGPPSGAPQGQWWKQGAPASPGRPAGTATGQLSIPGGRPPTVARGKIEDQSPVPLSLPAGPVPTVAHSPLRMPTPEELGLSLPPVSAGAAVPASAPVDWNDTHARLRKLGALGFQVLRLQDGRHRVTFILPTAQADRTQHVEATAASEAEAVAAALASAERLNTGRSSP